ncbi:MAG: methylenetetrahydrofolate--tRNA-(uracil(54)-C(5))-methyltransferase (FADH(2)-oxidizing) TrmFO [Clostridia bacterium]|nr:methylenetetrahydrofolate--tRNA-(uracil(54)-C(5))-methyltransferase (FADH(2)-oxidizing) TrmFO [Clostridia bacterium]
MNNYITVIGGGLAGAEAAYQIAKRGIKVKLYEMKPQKFSPAHTNENLAEIVCSNSFKSNLITNACGLLKEELRILDSLLIRIADETSVPAGQALAVDREKFSKKVTEELLKNNNIEIVHAEFGTNNLHIKEMAEQGIVIVATGPLTSEPLVKEIAELTGGEGLYFYDAAAPIVEKGSIDMNIAFWGDRYDQERGKDENLDEWKKRVENLKEADYINLPMNKEEYEIFVNELVNAEVVELHEFEKREIFEGCMPIEIMAKRGLDTLRFGPLKPVGFTDLRTGHRPYSVVQLRQDNSEGTMYNIVGFQTNLKFGEQKRVFSLIPGLENANFLKYGVMHRNTYINSPELLDETYNFKSNKNIFFAGQITGVEGYVESISSGLVAGINACIQFYNKQKHNCQAPKAYCKSEISENVKSQDCTNREKEVKLESSKIFDNKTMIGALAKYISTENKRFQPMNANFGILPELNEKIKDKKVRYEKLAKRSLELLK